MENNKKPNSKAIWIIAILLFLFISYVLGNSDSYTDYYVDYNDNGKMDKGEYAYSADSDGNEHWDLDGDGWWDD